MSAASPVVRVLRAGLGALILVALAVQLERSSSNGFSVVSFFSFFTVESNVLAVAALLALAWAGAAPRPPIVEGVRGLAVFAMTVTGVIFALFLADLQEELQTTIPWVDFVLHRLGPLVLLADWLLDPPRPLPRLRVALAWVAFPAIYAAYSLVRGAVVDWYPYPFLDASVHGVGGVLLRGVPLLLGMAAIACVLRLGARLRTAPR